MDTDFRSVLSQDCISVLLCGPLFFTRGVFSLQYIPQQRSVIVASRRLVSVSNTYIDACYNICSLFAHVEILPASRAHSLLPPPTHMASLTARIRRRLVVRMRRWFTDIRSD